MGNLVTQGLGVGAGGGGTAPVGPPPLAVYSWPVTVAPDFTLNPTATYLDIAFSLDLQALALQAASPEFWLFTGTSAISCTSVSKPNAYTIRLHHTEATDGASYTIKLPATGIFDVWGTPYNDQDVLPFVGVGILPAISISQGIDGRHVRVIYSEPVSISQATNVANYSITPSLAIVSIESESATSYIITTDLQTPGVGYTITASNIRDNSNNPV